MEILLILYLENSKEIRVRRLFSIYFRYSFFFNLNFIFNIKEVN